MFAFPPLNVCLVGYGFAGQTFHAPLIAATPGLRLSCIVTGKPAKARADHPGAIVFGSPEEAFASPEVQLIVIATPNETHFDLALRSLNAGKAVVVDKPFTVTVAEAETLVRNANDKGLTLSVFQNRRWDGDFLTLRQVIASGILGEIRYYESRFDRFRPEVRDRWRERDVPGGGLWYDLGPHLVDQALQLFGEPDSVDADLAIQRDGGVATDYFHVVLKYGALRVVLHASMLAAAESPRFVVHGTRGSFVKYGVDPQEEMLKAGKIAPGASGWGIDTRLAHLTTELGGALRISALEVLPGDYPTYYAGVRDAILGVGKNPVPASEGLAVMRIIEAGVRAT